MHRAFYLVPPLGFVTVFGIARFLEPHPSGLGTHQGLGLPACIFLKFTGIICPSCGLTTSFAWMARGELGRAWQVHPLGPILFVLFAWVALLSLLRFFGRGHAVWKLHQNNWVSATFAGLFVFLGVWLIRLILI